MSTEVAGSKVWVVLTCWDGGEDIDVFASKEEAEKARLQIVLDFVANAHFSRSGLSEQVLRHISSEDVASVVVQQALGEYAFSCMVMPRTIKP